MRRLVVGIVLGGLVLCGRGWAGPYEAEARMKTIVFEELDFRAIVFSDAVQYLREQSRARDPCKKGVNLLLKLDPARNPTITLKHGKTTFYQALHMLTAIARYDWRYIGGTLVLEPRIDAEGGE